MCGSSRNSCDTFSAYPNSQANRRLTNDTLFDIMCTRTLSQSTLHLRWVRVCVCVCTVCVRVCGYVAAWPESLASETGLVEIIRFCICEIHKNRSVGAICPPLATGYSLSFAGHSRVWETGSATPTLVQHGLFIFLIFFGMYTISAANPATVA